jgi:c-di-GMP-binding flagellar brake protein YcgR
MNQPVNRNSAPAAKAEQKERRGRRVPITCRLFLFGDNDFEAEARVLDLSAGGCRAESSSPLEMGMELKLSLFLTDHPWPIRIDGAIVRWVSGDTFGVEFFSIRPAVQDRIRKFVRDHPAGKLSL